MAHTGKVFVFVSRTSIDVHTNAREMTGQGLCRDTHTIGKGGDLIEFYRVLGESVSRKEYVCMGTNTRRKRTFSSATVDANLLECLDDAVHILDAARRAAGRNIITITVDVGW
jgi:hypothetical protein